MIRSQNINIICSYTLCETMPMGEMGDRLKAARVAAGYRSARAAAIRRGWKVPTYSAHENGQNGFGPEDAIRYAKAFKTSPGYLFFGDPAPDLPERLARASAAIAVVDRPFPEAVPHMANRSGNGPPDEWWRIPPAILRDLAGSDAENIVSFAMDGDSMEPAIQRTDVVFIDTSRQKIEPDGIWAVDYGQGRTLRRVVVERGGDQARYVLRPDNKSYTDITVDAEDVAILGRYVGRFSVF